MKKFKLLLVICTATLSSSALAIGMTAEQGKNFTNLNAEIGKSSSGAYIEGNWLKNTEDGMYTGGLGLGYNLHLGPVMINAGAKAVYLEQKNGENGVTYPVGGGVIINLTDSIHLYGEGYTASNSISNSIKKYTEANGGISWTPFTPVTLKVGYRYVSAGVKEEHSSHNLIDGTYIGGGVTF